MALARLLRRQTNLSFNLLLRPNTIGKKTLPQLQGLDKRLRYRKNFDAHGPRYRIY
jgi:hypothetical protein